MFEGSDYKVTRIVSTGKIDTNYHLVEYMLYQNFSQPEVSRVSHKLLQKFSKRINIGGLTKKT